MKIVGYDELTGYPIFQGHSTEYKKGYIDAIDEFVDLIKSNARTTNHYKYYTENNVMDILYFEEDIKKIAEQLKDDNDE